MHVVCVTLQLQGVLRHSRHLWVVDVNIWWTRWLVNVEALNLVISNSKDRSLPNDDWTEDRQLRIILVTTKTDRCWSPPMWQKVEVVWVDGSVRLLGASASKPAMGCGGSKAQPASEVDFFPCFCFDCVFLSSSPCAFLLSECHYVWRRVDSCDRFDTPF